MSLDIEKEFDQRYEGFDYDDIDEPGVHLAAPKEADHTGKTARAVGVLESPPGWDVENAIKRARTERAEKGGAGEIDVLERAEELAQAAAAEQGPHARLESKLAGGSGPRPTTAVCVDADMRVNAQERLAVALARLHEQRPANPHATAAALVLKLMPPGVSRSMAQTRLTNLLLQLRNAVAGGSQPVPALLQVLPARKPTPAHLRTAVDCAVKLASNEASADEAVCLLLRLASDSVDGPLLAQTGAGKRLRALKRQAPPTVARAAAAVVTAWKAAVLQPG